MEPKPATFFRHSVRYLKIFLLGYLAVMAFDLLVYGLNQPDLAGRFIWHFFFAFLYTHIYNQAAFRWRYDVDAKKYTASKFVNSILFSSAAGLLFIVVIALSHYLVSFVYIFLLDGIRGVPPEDIGADCVLIGKAIIIGGVCELCGRDESNPERG